MTVAGALARTHALAGRSLGGCAGRTSPAARRRGSSSRKPWSCRSSIQVCTHAWKGVRILSAAWAVGVHPSRCGSLLQGDPATMERRAHVWSARHGQDDARQGRRHRVRCVCTALQRSAPGHRATRCPRRKAVAPECCAPAARHGAGGVTIRQVACVGSADVQGRSAGRGCGAHAS